MSGSITGGVDASIPLRAGGNPLESAGKFVDTMRGINELQAFPGRLELQRQAIQGGAAGLAQKLNQVGASMLLPTLSNPNFTMDDLTRAAGAAEHGGGSTDGVLRLLGAIPFAPNTPEWRTAIKQGAAALAQVNPSEAVAQIAGTPAEQQTANGINAGVRAPATAGGGFAPATATPMGLAPQRIQRPATAEDVAANPSLVLGQPTFGVLPGVGGNLPAPANPAANLGPGTYRPPQRPLNQLGPAYAPGGAAPAAPRGPPPGTQLMTAPDGSRGYVPLAQVPAAIEHGYK